MSLDYGTECATPDCQAWTAGGGFPLHGRETHPWCEQCQVARGERGPHRKPDPLARSQRVRAVLTYAVELDGPGPYSEEDRHEAVESLLAMGALPSTTRFLDASEPAAVVHLTTSPHAGASTAVDSGAPPYAPALIQAHRLDLAEALGASDDTEWVDLLAMVRKLREPDFFEQPEHDGFAPVRRRS